ncbi:MAG: hypothetical protein ABF611_10735 [Acetobacter orientalis]|uniref:hypothetical protein n=1 Tax=Acetobacter orientalis TaxID=146474 RepID=UPI0039E8D39E
MQPHNRALPKLHFLFSNIHKHKAAKRGVLNVSLLSLAAYLAATSSLSLPKHSKIVAKAASFTVKNSAISHF